MRINSSCCPLILFVALGVSVWSSQPASASYVHSANATHAVNQDKTTQTIPPLPDAVLKTEIKALDGSAFRLADFQGKVIVVNLWASWCGPCRSDIPHLIELSREFSSRGVEVIGLTTEDPKTDAAITVEDFVEEFKIPYKIGWGDQSFAMALMQGQIRNNIPQTFVISRDGRVLKRFVGFSQKETPPKMRQAVEEALNEQDR